MLRNTRWNAILNFFEAPVFLCFSASFFSSGDLLYSIFFSYTCIRLHTYIFSTFPHGVAVFIWSVFVYRICVRMYYLFCNDMFTHLFSPFFCSCSIMAPKLLPNCKRSRELVRPRGLLSELPLQLQEEKLDCQLANIGW